MFEHVIELPGRTLTMEFPYRWCPPVVIHVDGKAYVAVPTLTLVDVGVWRYVAY